MMTLAMVYFRYEQTEQKGSGRMQEVLAEMLLRLLLLVPEPELRLLLPYNFVEGGEVVRGGELDGQIRGDIRKKRGGNPGRLLLQD